MVKVTYTFKDGSTLVLRGKDQDDAVVGHEKEVKGYVAVDVLGHPEGYKGV